MKIFDLKIIQYIPLSLRGERAYFLSLSLWERVGVRVDNTISPAPSSPPTRNCVVIGETVKNVMPNLFRHLIKSRPYETLNQPMKRVQGMVQGDKKGITTQSFSKGRMITPPFGKGRLGGILLNSRGISVLFLLVAMLLMVSIGYVFSYLIPTKQKSVRFPIYSTQAFFIAQSGVEFATRYCSDRGWRGTTDGGIFDLDRLDNIWRDLGNGRFTIVYDQPTNTLTSTGQITGISERRMVRVSNFSQFSRLTFNPASPVPCWSLGTRRARFFITNVRNTNVVLRSFSASWTQTGAARNITRIDMNAVQKYTGTYSNEGAPQNLNRPIGNPSQTINPTQVINVLIRWDFDIANGANIMITFYTGLLGTGDAYTFNLDSAGNGLPNC